ncbi:Rv1733c family protein [Streptomyces sp. 2A115]|uniref:Rv1733c family protein n=1 Tax=Streptomyces sp. 2A115 TaxID=3457439 RepID=UPI003FD3A29A
MAALRGPRVLLWRWWPNPLRRRSDTLEGWVVLAVWTLTLLAGALAGLATAQSVEHSLADQRAEWRPVLALLTERAPGTTASGAERVWAEVRWTATDGSAHTGQTRVEAGSTAGTPVTVWTDGDGRLATKPATRAQAALRGALVGTLVGMSAAAVPYGGGRLVRERLERRRLDRWDAEWEQVGPQWGWKTG